jgi:hypothetical protein
LDRSAADVYLDLMEASVSDLSMPSSTGLYEVSCCFFEAGNSIVARSRVVANLSLQCAENDFRPAGLHLVWDRTAADRAKIVQETRAIWGPKHNDAVVRPCDNNCALSVSPLSDVSLPRTYCEICASSTCCNAAAGELFFLCLRQGYTVSRVVKRRSCVWWI